MSVISNSHTVQGYESGKTKPLEGQRLAKVTYKVDKATGVKPDSKSVSIPVLKFADIEPHISALQGAIVELVHKTQDSIIRELIEAGASSINDEQISMSAVISNLLDSSGGRLTGDAIREWFNDSLHDPLMLAFASKLGIAENSSPTPEQESKLSKILKGYEDSFAKLASGAATFSQLQKDNMIKALSLADDSDSLASKFVERLSKQKQSDDELLMAL